MAKIYERLQFRSIPQEKRRDSFDPKSKNLLGEDSTWMVNQQQIPRMINCFCFLFVYYIIELLRLFQSISCVLSSEHKNQNVATIGTSLDHIHVEL